MPNIIAKKLNITLDTIKQTPLTIKPDKFNPIIGDSTEITINIIENGESKDITGTRCKLIGVKSNNEYFEQSEDITIEDGVNGIVKIYPRLDIFNVEGKTICCLVVEDLDETINIQRFIVIVGKSIARDIIVESKEEIETLAKLNDLLDGYRSDLDIINTSVQTMVRSVDDNVLATNTKFNDLNDAIDLGFVDIENRINNIDKTIDNELAKIIKLSTYDVVGSNFIYMATPIFTVQAKQLLKKSYMVFIGGKFDTNTHSANGILNFYETNGKVYTNFLTLSDRVINSRNIQPSVVFDDLTTEISPSKTNFRLLIKSNIRKDLNTVDDVVCVLTPFGLQ